MVLSNSDDEPGEDVDDADDERRDDIAFDEFHRAIHRAEELRFARERASTAARLGAVDRAGSELGVDRHLLAGHRVEDEARRDLGHALRAFGDDDELDERQNQKDDASDDVVAANDEIAERANDLAGVGLKQDEARARDV